MARLVHTMAVSGFLMTVCGWPVAASTQSRAGTLQGYAHAYDLQFDAAHATLAEAVSADRADPAPHRAIAAVIWMEILFIQGITTFEAFTGEITQSDIARPAVPVALATRFARALAEARELADRQVAASDDADAHYQVGATALLAAVYGATVEGRTIASLTHGRRAVAEMGRARALAPSMREAGLALGMSQYTIATLSWPVRLAARLGGLTGNRDRGLRLLEEASDASAATRSDALLLLMIIDSREARPVDAIRRLTVLQQRHPHNRLLWLNHGAAALVAQRWADADQVLSRGIVARAWETGPAVLGEPAMWFAYRGTARARLGRRDEALDDLRQGLASSPRDWIRGRLHQQLGALALAAGDVPGARREFDAAIHYSRKGGDAVAADVARRSRHALPR